MEPTQRESLQYPRIDEPLIDAHALAEFLGASTETVRKWLKSGPEAGLLPPWLRINGLIRWRPADVRTWIASKEVR